MPLRRLFAPSFVDLFFAVLCALLIAQPGGLRMLLADGDTGWHVRTGELVLATGHAPSADPFSFTRPGERWFAWEWLSDVIFARAFQWRGLGGVAALCALVLALSSAVLFARLLRRDCGLWIALAATLAAVSASSVHYLARPHVFSILLYTLSLGILEQDRIRPGPRLWLLVPLTAVWTNLHGGFVAWIATVGLLALFYMVQREWRPFRRYATLATACAAASLINPFGWRLHEHVLRYLSAASILENVQEFQSPNIRSEAMVVFAVLLLAAAAMVSRAEPFEALLVLLWGFAAMRSARHIPLFAIVAAPVLATGLASLWRHAAARFSNRSPAAVFWDLGQHFARARHASLWLAVPAVCLMLDAPALSFPEQLFPVQALDANLTRIVPAAAAPRVLTSDQWGDYLIFRTWPRQHVFFDGRSDFYGPELLKDYRKLLCAEAPWREVLDRYGFDLALLPHSWALSTALEHEPGWQKVYEDKVAVLFQRNAGSGTP